MSEGWIQLPPDGTGKRARALVRSVGGVEVYERAHVFVEPATGEPMFRWYPTYAACVAGSGVAANRHHLVIFNGSNRVLRVMRVLLCPENTAAITGFWLGFRLYRTTTAGSGGTAITVAKMDTSDPDLPTGITVWTNPTTAPTLGPLVSTVGVNPEETGGCSTPTIAYEWLPWMKPLTLRTNEGITVQQYGTAGAGLINVVAIFQVV